ncbi:MAG: hypothetical protein AB7G13_05680 [Lautropia sp.]
MITIGGQANTDAPSPVHILIYEPDYKGHRLTAVRVLLESLLEMESESGRRFDIVVTTGHEAIRSREFEIQLEPISACFRLNAVEGVDYGASPARIAAAKARELLRILRAGTYDHLYVPYGDGLVQWLGMLRLTGCLRWPADLVAEAVLMRGTFAYTGRLRSRSVLALAACRSAPFRHLHLIDPFAFARLPRWRGLRSKVDLMPDPTPAVAGTDRLTARRLLGLPEGGRYVGCAGQIDERKGIPALIEAFRRAALLPTDRLLLAGRCSDGVRKRLHAVGDGRIVVLDRYLTEAELHNAVSAIDLIVTPYPNFVGSVSICIRAAGAGRMCLGDESGWMGYVIPRFELGATCAVSDVGALARAIERHLPGAVGYVADGRARTFASFFQPSNTNAHWTALLRRRLGLRPDPRKMSWPDPAPAPM